MKWFDAGGHVFTGILGNEEETYYNANGDLIVEKNKAVKDAWDLTVEAIKGGQSAALPEFTPEWNTGFQQGQFATITCPAWMMGYIQGNAPETKGKWDIAKIPGGSGNWGGSYVTVPVAGQEHRRGRRAGQVADRAGAERQAVQVDRQLPEPGVDLVRSPRSRTSPRSSSPSAPAGKIYPASLENAPVQVYGPQSGVIGNTFAGALNSVEQGTDPDEAWESAMTDIKAAAGEG